VFQLKQKNSEKLISTFSYLTFGIFGFFTLIIHRKTKSSFFKFHVYQSIVLSLSFYLLRSSIEIFCDLLRIVLKYLPVEFIVRNFLYFLGKIMFFPQVLYFGLVFFCIFTLWQNKYSEIKWISEQVNRMI